ncbi:inositol 1,4,5-trisphosphate receptor-interacting protein-like 2 [Megalops cyprinoides]|uniref:inositol 1,4,5-trisphosphate receptor-interacting protein-like 2 n=1 Tax=Megalops cyprinoides TaxID=118141 RepID=UPI001863C015|nr:inositol 1,4,5-trisphosphate receptor-interacting protein-like 2 [Megalops cyprinoides]
MTVYTLNLRVFWPLVFCVFTAFLVLQHSFRRGPNPGSDGCPDQTLGILSLIKFAFAFGLCYFLIRYCSSQQSKTKRGTHEAPEAPVRAGSSRKELLEDYYERQVRLSPHVLGHSKAHVAKLVSELVRAGRAEIPPESSLGLRGDFVQIGSAYEEHKVGRPDCFDILVPLRLPRGLKMEPSGRARDSGGPPLCILETPRKSEWARQHKAFTEAFLSTDRAGGAYRLTPAAVLRWFYPTVQRCLSAVRYPFEQRCLLGLSLSDDRILLRLTPRSDYVCCHISMGVRLIPAVPLGDGVFLVPAARGPQQEDLWTVYFPRQEQKLLSWLKGRVPSGSCHLKCLQIVKAVRDLSGQALDSRGGAEWRAILSSYYLKTAWLRLLLSTPPEAWEDRYLLDRLEDLLRTLKDSLQRRSLGHLFLGGDTGLLPEFLALPKPFKDTASSNLLANFNPASLDLVSARLAYSWTHLHRLIRLGCPQRDSLARGVRCKHMDTDITDSGA